MSRVLRCVDESTRWAELGWKTRAGKLGEKLMQKTWARANSGEVELGQGRSGRTRARSWGRKLGRGHRTGHSGEVVRVNRTRSSGDLGEVIRASRVRSSGDLGEVVQGNRVRSSGDLGEVVWRLGWTSSSEWVLGERVEVRTGGRARARRAYWNEESCGQVTGVGCVVHGETVEMVKCWRCERRCDLCVGVGVSRLAYNEARPSWKNDIIIRRGEQRVGESCGNCAEAVTSWATEFAEVGNLAKYNLGFPKDLVYTL